MSVYTTSQLVIYYLVLELLEDHDLSREDREWAARGISKKNVDPWILLLMAKKTNTGRFALSFNDKLDYLITTRNNLDELLEKKEELFGELFANEELTREEVSVISHHVKREYNAICNAVEELIAKFNHSSSITLGLGDINSVYERCYHGACLDESNDPLILSTTHQIPQVIFVSDSGPISGGLNYVYGFEYMDLIRLLSKDNVINPYTRQPFSQHVKQNLQARFLKEIKMYTAYCKTIKPGQ